jgi:DNA-binding response OmpR family regulator
MICRMIADVDVDASPMVLMLTASGAPGERVSGLSIGADDYLAKPFHFPELVLRVRALARRRPVVGQRIYRACGIELDPLRHSATRDGHPLDLQPKNLLYSRR